MIQGLTYVPNYLGELNHNWLFAKLTLADWSNELKRRVQHYGYKYDYRKRAIDKSMAVPMPEWGVRLATMLHSDGLMPFVADQIIVNEYLPGQGIGAHIDCEPCFADTICSLTLNSACIMDFRKDGVHHELYLEPESVLVITGEARYDWTHGIASRTFDMVNGVRVGRRVRLSLTLRKVILS